MTNWILGIYQKKEWRCFFKHFVDTLSFKLFGRLFHNIESEKDKLDLKRSNFGWGTISFLELYLFGAFDMMSVRYAGVSLLYILWTRRVLLRSSCFLSGSMFSFFSFSSVEVDWLQFICFTALLCIEFNFLNVSWLQPSQIVEA